MLNQILIAFFASCGIIIVKHLIPYILKFVGLKHDPPIVNSLIIIGFEWLFIFFITLIFIYAAQIFDDNFLLLIIVFALFLPIITSFEFIFRPLLLFLQSNLKQEKDLSKWLKTAHGISLRIYCYKGELVNAYATGAVPFSNTIILGDALIKKLDERSLKTIILHETGHLVLNHLFSLYLVNVLSMSLFAFILSFLFYLNLGSEFLNILVFGTVAAVAGGIIFDFAPRVFKKRIEHQADLYATKRMCVETFKQALVQLDKISDGRVRKGGRGYPTLDERVNYVKSKLKIE